MNIKIIQKGFTLMELLVVMTVMSILAGIALYGAQHAQRSGRDTRRMVTVDGIQIALECFYRNNGSYPGSMSWTSLQSYLGISCIGVSAISDPSGPVTWNGYVNAVRTTRPVYVYTPAGSPPTGYTLTMDGETKLVTLTNPN